LIGDGLTADWVISAGEGWKEEGGIHISHVLVKCGICDDCCVKPLIDHPVGC